MAKKQPNYDRLTKSIKRRGSATPRVAEIKPLTPSRRPVAGSRIPRASGSPATPTRERSRDKLLNSPANSFTREKERTPSFTRSSSNTHPAVSHLSKKWQHLWLLSMDRLRRLQERLERISIKRASANFNFKEWKSRFNKWLHDSKSRVQDIFRRMDHDRDGKLTREQFISGVLNTSFPTERWEMDIVAILFVKNGLIDYKDFINALKDKPATKKPEKPKTEGQQILSEIDKLVNQCCCAHRYEYVKVDENKFRFGDSQKLRLVRILRSTVMVRVGGGWETLQAFLQKNDPCRAEGRTNVELREQLLASGATQSMKAFKTKRPGISREGSDVSKPSIARENSGSLRSKPPSGAKTKRAGEPHTHLSVPGVRREKSGDLRSPGITKSRSGTNLKSRTTPIGAKTSSSGNLKEKPPASPRRSDSQTSIGSTGSLDGSDGTLKSPTSAASSRIPVGRTVKSPESRLGLSKSSVKGSRENLAKSSLRGSKENLAAKGSTATSKSSSSSATKSTTSTAKKPTTTTTKKPTTSIPKTKK